MSKNPHPDKPILEYNYIDFGIYIGTNQCCKMHVDEMITMEGVEAIMSLEDERIDAPFGVPMYSWIPVKNDRAPSMDQFEYGVTILDKLVQMGKRVYVHCQFGHGRAPTMVAAYLISKQGMKPEKALEFIKQHRPGIHLESHQLDALMKFSAE